MRTMAPTRGLVDLRNQVDRLFERLWEPEFVDVPVASEWIPKLDMSETREAISLKVEVPGIDPKDIQITLQDQLLTIKGEKRQEKEEKDERYYRTERSYGSFVRTIRLPSPVDSTKVNATFKHGLLMVGMTKTTAPNGTVIPIQST